MDKEPQRCWNTTDPIYNKYHDEEWGVPVHDDRLLFEFLVLEGFQAGLTWLLILQRRESFREAFDNFNAQKIANYTDADFERLMKTPNLVHNKLKIKATINNSRQFLLIQKQFGSFDTYIWRFVDDKPIVNGFERLEDLPAETEQSKAMSVDLKKRGFKFVGPTICYAFMQATGLVNDHLTSCFRYKQLSEKHIKNRQCSHQRLFRAHCGRALLRNSVNNKIHKPLKPCTFRLGNFMQTTGRRAKSNQNPLATTPFCPYSL
jgi:DNA-3-methyladenine glycosylase I